MAVQTLEHAADAAAHSPVQSTPSQRTIALTVSAAISLKDASQDAKSAFIKEYPNIDIVLNFGASGMLRQQIENGAPVDVFISAAPKEMDALETKGLLLAGSRRNLVRNEIVLIVPLDSAGIMEFSDLAHPNVTRVAVGEPSSVPAGWYAQEVLQYFEVLAAVKSKAVLAKDVRQVLAYVETGNADAGIVYRSDAFANRRVKVVMEAPKGSHSPIVYPGAVMRASPHPDAAGKFLAYLASESGRQIFAKRGFSVDSRND